VGAVCALMIGKSANLAYCAAIILSDDRKELLALHYGHGTVQSNYNLKHALI